MIIRPRNPGESAQEYAYNTLRDSIVFCELEPGTFLNLQDICDQLQISRTPVREAILRLERERIVEVYPQSGSMVSYVDFRMADNANFVRRAVEKDIVREVCIRATEADFEQLSNSLELQAFYDQRARIADLIQEDNHFHDLLFAIADRPNLNAFFLAGLLHLDRVRNLRTSTIRENMVVIHHTVIYDALRLRDPDAASRAMADHLSEYALSHRIAIVERYPTFFRPGELDRLHEEAMAAGKAV